MKKLVAAAIAALIAIVPGAAVAQSRIFQFTADAVESYDGGTKQYGLTAQGSFFADGGTSDGTSTVFHLTGVRSGTATFYNDFDLSELPRSSAITGLFSAPPFFIPLQQIVLAADGSLVSARFSLMLSGFPDLFEVDSARQIVFFGGEGSLKLNGLRVGAISAAAVPEPAAWALMIAGFGAVGTAMRRRRVRVAFA